MKNNLFIPVDIALKDTVQLYWQTEGLNDFHQEVIIPKGIVELIFNFYDTSDFYARQGNQKFQLPLCMISGYCTRPIHLQLPGQQSSFGVVLYPAAVQPVFGVPAGELADKCVDMTLLDSSMSSLWHRLAEQTNFHERVRIFSEWLKQRTPYLNAREKAFNTYLNMTSDKLLSVSEIADWLCYSHRHLSRKLQQLTGMNTEQTLLYKRHIRSIYLMHQTRMSLTEISYACDFADQSHFIKTFKSFAALTPSDYKNRKSQIIGHFFESVR